VKGYWFRGYQASIALYSTKRLYFADTIQDLKIDITRHNTDLRHINDKIIALQNQHKEIKDDIQKWLNFAAVAEHKILVLDEPLIPYHEARQYWNKQQGHE